MGISATGPASMIPALLISTSISLAKAAWRSVSSVTSSTTTLRSTPVSAASARSSVAWGAIWAPAVTV